MNGEDSNTNDETKPDLFGMDLLYNEVKTGLHNKRMYNGNIPAMS